MRLEALKEDDLRAKKAVLCEKYCQTHKLSREDEKFCEKIDWHPVDELPLKKEFVEKLKRVKKGPYSKPMSLKELDELMGL